jgi:hypothetical protein
VAVGPEMEFHTATETGNSLSDLPAANVAKPIAFLRAPWHRRHRG